MKRINVKLVAGLAIGVILFVAGTVGLHEFQSNRGADRLLVRAEELKSEGDYFKAIKLLRNYLRRRPDDSEQRTNLAITMKDMLSSFVEDGKQVSNRTLSETFNAIEDGLRHSPDDLELRDAAVNFNISMRRFPDAIVHLNQLIEAKKGTDEEPGLRVKLAQCLLMGGEETDAAQMLHNMVGFDQQTLAFVPDQATCSDAVSAYMLLAEIYERNRQNKDAANAIVNQMVVANPKSYKALVNRSRFLSIYRENTTLAAKDIERAVELAPEEMSVLSMAGDMALRENKLARAKELFDKVLSIDSNQVSAFSGLARWAAAGGDMVRAIEFLNKGIAISPRNFPLYWTKANFQLEQEDISPVKDTMEELRKLNAAKPYLDFLEGRYNFAQKNWLVASQKLEDARPFVAQQRPQFLSLLDGNLAICYEKLGQNDLRKEIYEGLVEREPNNVGVRLALIQSMVAMRQYDDAVENYEIIRQNVNDLSRLPIPWQLVLFQFELLKQQQRDEPVRNFNEAEAMLRQIGNNDAVPKALLAKYMKEYYDAKGDEVASQKLLDRVRQQAPDSLAAKLREITDLASQPGGYDEANTKLTSLRAAEGDLLQLRVVEASMLATNRPEGYQSRLLALEENVGDYDEEQQLVLWSQLAKLHGGLNNTDEARRLWAAYVEKRPSDIPNLMRLFEFSVVSRNEEHIRDALSRIETTLGRDSAEWKWARAAQIVEQLREQKLDDPNEATREARGLIDEAIGKRKDWEPLYRIRGEIGLLMGDKETAIESYERAMMLGSTNIEAKRRLARLYFDRRELQKSLKTFFEVPKSLWQPIDQQLVMAIQSELGELPENIDYDPESRMPNQHTMVGATLMKAERYEEAEQAFRRAIKLDPTKASYWGFLFELYMKTGRDADARSLLTEAAPQLDEQAAPIFFGTSYHLLRDWEKAESEFLTAISQRPDDARVKMSLAKVYLASNQLPKAKSTLEQMVGDTPAHQESIKPTVAWARRKLAGIVARPNTYETFRQAQQLIEANAPKGAVLPPQDLLVWAQLASNRTEAVTLQDAIRALEIADDDRGLIDDEKLVLAGMYKRQDRWSDCERIMLDLLSRNSTKPEYITSWLSWLVDQDRIRQAQTWVDKVPPKSMPYIRTMAHIASSRGNVDQAIRNVAEEIPDQQTISEIPELIALATILEEISKYDPKSLRYAERIWTKIAEVQPTRYLQLAGYYNRRDDAKSAVAGMGALAKAFKQNSQLQIPVMQLSVVMYRKHFGTLNQDPKYQNAIRQMFDAARVDQPDSGTLLILLAEFEELVGNSQEATDLLAEFLAKPNANPTERAVVLNNLAYKRALQGDGDTTLIDEAFKILGPRADLRDTKGMVQLAGGNFEEAIREFQTSIDVGGPSAVKYYHLALAHWKNNNRSEAADAMNNALRMGILDETLPAVEKQQLTDLMREMDGLLDDLANANN